MNRRNAGFDRTPLRPERVRSIDGSFATLPHRFLRDGFWASLQHQELLLYFLLVLVADRQGMSFYYDDRLAAILRLVLGDFLAARAGLLRQDLIAYDPVGPRYQVLSLPPRHRPVATRVLVPQPPRQPPVASRVSPPQPRPAAASAVPVRELVRNLLARIETAGR